MINAAGILFLAPDKTVLFLKRGPSVDYPLTWCFPGGAAEDDETPEQTAMRECIEEVGFLPKGALALLTKTITPTAPPIPRAVAAGGDAASAPRLVAASPPPIQDEVSFVTFLQRVKEQFEPTTKAVKDEHVGYAWAPADQPPEPLHPGCRTPLARLSMDELGVARAMAAGDLTSPQRYENVTLFDIRITGTNTAFRKKLNEVSYRPPEIFLSDDFLARCNGLPVIVEHPEKSTLDSKEYNDRNVGSVFLPYIKGDEVWGIAKLYDDAAIKMLMDNQMSTSPAVVFRDPEVNETLTLDDGRTLLIEGKPSLLDHIAICERGVWDKGGEPSGVIRGDSDMPVPEELKKDAETEEQKKALEKANETKDDADGGEQVDKLLKGLCDRLDSLGKRMDSYDEEDKKKADGETEGEDFMKKDKRKDAKEEDDEPPFEARKDKKRKDAKRRDEKEEDDEDEEERKDKRKDRADARADSEPLLTADAVRKLIADSIPKREDVEVLTGIQARADAAYTALGSRAPAFLAGESAQTYRKRLMGGLKSHSKDWKDADIGAINDTAALDTIERRVYADAEYAGRHPVNLGADELRSIRRVDETGRNVTEFAGSPIAWMGQFGGNRRQVAGIRTKN